MRWNGGERGITFSPPHPNVLRAGRTYAFDRPASPNADGSFDLGQLRDDEVMLSPGLIYRAVTV